MLVFAVYGHKNSGKTSLIVNLINLLKDRGYSIGVIKGIHHDDFFVDVEGKDTWRFKEMGARLVVGISGKKTFMVWDNEKERKYYLQRILDCISEGNWSLDVLFLEGLMEETKKLPGIFKIVLLLEGETGEDFGVDNMENVLFVGRLIRDGEIITENLEKIFKMVLELLDEKDTT